MQPQSQKTKNDMPAINPEMEVPRPDLPATTKPAISPAKFDPQTTTASGIGETEVDAWYEKLDAGILSWEMKEMAKIEVQLAWPQPRTFNVKTIEIMGLAPRGLISSPRHILDQSLHLLVTAEVAVARDVAVVHSLKMNAQRTRSTLVRERITRKGLRVEMLVVSWKGVEERSRVWESSRKGDKEDQWKK
ncbi:hypothetical protein GH714_030107 [Hevea brasiliensis]|uniref:Uncharacterized protein n=1 Tax=Hevea brasiliensis TaxID=3981 RepID=A0A6A6L272_HEVBR|nr:hypothetical protein GH714_030107 [Hevea brasiliensis]